MLRSIMQVYVKGSVEAVALYQEAFDAALGNEHKHEDGSYYHSELDIYGQILAVSEAGIPGKIPAEERSTGNTMQFALHFKENEIEKVKHAYEVLKPGSQILFPLGPCDFSSCMADLIDRFGVRWCLFI